MLPTLEVHVFNSILQDLWCITDNYCFLTLTSWTYVHAQGFLVTGRAEAFWLHGLCLLIGSVDALQ